MSFALDWSGSRVLRTDEKGLRQKKGHWKGRILTEFAIGIRRSNR